MPKIPPFRRQFAGNPWHDVEPLEGLPEASFYTVIEIPMGGSNKYELDKKSGMLKLDRVLYSAVHYPANYGFIPQSLAEDGDPLDVLVLCSAPLNPLTLVAVRPIGLIAMSDQESTDNKIIAVPIRDPEYESYKDVHELPAHRLAVLKRFFEDYKALENKTVVVEDISGPGAASSVIVQALELYRKWKEGEDMGALLRQAGDK